MSRSSFALGLARRSQQRPAILLSGLAFESDETVGGLQVVRRNDETAKSR